MSLSYVQGDSIARDIQSSDISSFASSNWSGTWAVVAKLGGTALASGSLAKSTDNTKFQMRVTPIQCSTLPLGEVYLIAQVVNPSIGYSKEVLQERITITQQGIPG